MESISNVSCNEKDKQALLTLKHGLTDHEHVLSSWSDHKDCCMWDRVSCDNKTGRVTELHLNYSSLEYEYDYGSYLENLMLVPKGHELQYEENLKFLKGANITYWDVFLDYL
nr:polygalacturonase inhibitor [Quercus suber]